MLDRLSIKNFLLYLTNIPNQQFLHLLLLLDHLLLMPNAYIRDISGYVWLITTFLKFFEKFVVERLRGMPSSGLEPETSPLPRECSTAELQGLKKKWAGLDLNQRRQSQRIYSPPPLTTRAPTPTI